MILIDINIKIFLNQKLHGDITLKYSKKYSHIILD